MKKAGFLFVALISFALMHSNGLFSQPCYFTLYNNTNCDFTYELFWGGCGNCTVNATTGTMSASSWACITNSTGCGTTTSPWNIRSIMVSDTNVKVSMNCCPNCSAHPYPSIQSYSGYCDMAEPNLYLRWQAQNEAYIEDN